MLKLFRRDPGAANGQLEITVSNETVLRILALVFGVLILIGLVRQTAHALLLIFVAFFLALALNAPVQAIARRLPGGLRGKRSVATSISFLVVIAVLAAFMSSIVPPLIRQSESFINAAPALVESARSSDSGLGRLVQHYHLQSQISSTSQELSDRLRGLGSSALSTLGRIGSSLFAVLTILVMTFMMLIEGPRILEFARELVPLDKRANTVRLSKDMYRVIQGYVNGQVTLAALAAVLIVPALFILHISYPIALMVVIFICGLIPMVGHTIGAIIVTLVALATSPLAAVSILGYYILYQQIENYVIQPRIQANSTNMSPLLVFISVVIGVTFGGLVGGLFAIPVAGCLRILVLDYLVTHELISEATTPVVESTARQAKV